MQHSLGIRENMEEERRNVRLRISTWFDIAINVCEGKNKVSRCHRAIHYTSMCSAGTQEAGSTKGIKEEVPKSHPRFHLSKVNSQCSSFRKDNKFLSEKITNFFQKMSLIYGRHVTVKRQIIFISVLDPLVSARVSILLLTILKQTGDLLYTMHWKLA